MAASVHDVRLRPGATPLGARTILRLNALVSMGAGALLMVLAGPLARITEAGRSGAVLIFGAVLCGMGAAQLALAVRKGLRRGHLRVLAMAGIAWAAAFFAANAGAPAFIERAVIAIVAVGFGSFALAELRAARTL